MAFFDHWGGGGNHWHISRRESMTQGITRRSLLQSLAGGLAGGTLTAGLAAESLAGALPAPSGSASRNAPMERLRRQIDPDRVLLWENTRKEIRELLESGLLKAAILPAGSIEQHNEHIALVEDTAHATFYAKQIALELYPQVIVAPPSFCGYAPYWMSRKGSITLRRKTFQDYIFDVLHSLKTNGIHTLLVLNGHGGNQQPLKEMEETWRGKLGVTMEVDSVWAPTPPDFVKTVLESKKRLSHAEEYETSIALAAHPHRVRRVSMKEYDDANLNYESGFSPEVEHFLRIDGRTFIDGRINEEGENATDRARQEQSLLATAAKGEKLIARVVEYYVEKLQKMIAATESGQPWPPA